MIEQVTRVERLFRRLIDRVLTREHGRDYWKHVIPTDVQEKVELRVGLHLRWRPHLDAAEYRRPARRLEFCEVSDYRKIFSNKRTREAFKICFPSAEHCGAQLVLFEDYRNTVMHARQLDEFSRALGESTTQVLLESLTRALLVDETSHGPPATASTAGGLAVGDPTRDRVPARDGPADPELASEPTSTSGVGAPGAIPSRDLAPAPLVVPKGHGTPDPTARVNDDVDPATDQGRPVPCSTKDGAIDPTALPKELNKVWRKLSRFYDVSTVGQIVAIDPAGFRRHPGVGDKYVAAMEQLKRHLQQSWDVGERWSPGAIAGVADVEPVRLWAQYYLNWVELTREDHQAVQKVAKVMGVTERITANELLDMGDSGFSDHHGVGEHSVRRLRVLLRKIRAEAELLDDDESIGLPRRSILVPLAARSLTMAEVESLLIGDVQRFFAKGPPIEVTILRQRWGHGRPSRTLEEVGNGLARRITRERVRQLQKDGERHFRRSLGVLPECLKDIFQAHLHSDFSELMPGLASRFSSSKAFLDFLGMAAGAKGWLVKVQQAPEKRLDLLEGYFACRASPVPVDEVLEFLREQDDWTGAQASHYLRDLAARGGLILSDGQLVPQRMKKGAALAHVLFMHPPGLSWREAADAVNAGGFSKRPLSTVRPDGELTRSPQIYLAGRGFYRHVTHLVLSEETVVAVLTALRSYLSNQAGHTSNLQAAHQALWPPGTIDYFTVRYVCTAYGEDGGIYGTYQSSADTVSLKREHESIPTVEYVFSMIAESEVPLSADDVRERLRVQSPGWAALLLYRLVETGRIVELTQDRYLSHQAAVAEIEESGVRQAVDGALSLLGEASTLRAVRDLVNEEMGRVYTRDCIAMAARACGRVLPSNRDAGHEGLC